MRVLLVRHAADGLRAGHKRRQNIARGDPRVHLRQYVPLHRLPCHRRRRGGGHGQERQDEGERKHVARRIIRRYYGTSLERRAPGGRTHFGRLASTSARSFSISAFTTGFCATIVVPRETKVCIIEAYS